MFLFCFVLFFCMLSFLFRITIFHFCFASCFLLLKLCVFVALVFVLFLNLGYLPKNVSNIWKFQNPQNEK